jgi:WD40 repeat protein
MRIADLPTTISGHERSLTQIKFNREGDLLLSCSKDHVINVWYSHNGERLGTYDGNNGTVWTVDVDCKLFSFAKSLDRIYSKRLSSRVKIHGFGSS